MEPFRPLYHKLFNNHDVHASNLCYLIHRIFLKRAFSMPLPRCLCFYNGTVEQPERQVLRLSDAYEGDIEVKVTMLNINYGMNKQLTDA